MGEQTFTDVFGAAIVLVDDVRESVLVKHSEMRAYLHEVEAVLKTPDEIRRSNHDPRVVLYYRFVKNMLTGKYLVVVVKRVDRLYISTFYASDQMKRGETVWKSS